MVESTTLGKLDLGARFLKLGPKPTVVEVGLDANVETEKGEKGTFYRVHVLANGEAAILSGGAPLIDAIRDALKGAKGMRRIAVKKETDEGGTVYFSAERIA